MLVVAKNQSFKGKTEDLIDLPVIVRIRGCIGKEVLKEFTDDFQKASLSVQPVIPVVIETYGGECCAALSIRDIIKSSSKPVDRKSVV